jgi:hypothetical protein
VRVSPLFKGTSRVVPDSSLHCDFIMYDTTFVFSGGKDL